MGTDAIPRRRPRELQTGEGTVAAEVQDWPDISTTQVAAATLTDDIGFERRKARNLSAEYGDLHKRSLFVEWQVKTVGRGKAAPSELLAELGELGFAWRDIARLLSVSVAALQKWRRNEGVSGESRRRLASLVAACDLIRDHYGVQEIASWFEMPVASGAPVTPLDLYTSGEHKLVFDFASGQADPEQILTEFDEEWRERYRSDFTVFRAEDGDLAIRRKAH